MLRWDGFWDGLVCPAIEALLFGGPRWRASSVLDTFVESQARVTWTGVTNMNK